MTHLRGGYKSKVDKAVKNFENDFNQLVPDLRSQKIWGVLKKLKISYDNNITPFNKPPVTDGLYIYNTNNINSWQELTKLKKESQPIKIYEKFQCYLQALNNLLSNLVLTHNYGKVELTLCDNFYEETILDDELKELKEKIISYKNNDADFKELNFFDKFDIL